MLEHDGEVSPGLPAELPDSERVLWQGSPDWKLLARTKFRADFLAAYFAAMLVVHQVVQLRAGDGLAASLTGGLGYLVLAAIALTVVLAFARATARATMFTLTSQRIIIRCGVALPLSMNLPFSKIDSVDVRVRKDGFGDIALKPMADSRASYVLLWPYVRPWRYLRVQPMLRAIPDVQQVAERLARALGNESQTQSEATRTPVTPNAVAGRNDDRGFKPYPTIPLAAAVGLVVVTVLSTGWISATGNKPMTSEPADVVASIELRFEDLADGSISVIDASTNTILETLEPGSGGFLRSTLRGLARVRALSGYGAETPFSLKRTSAGRILLTDPVNRNSVDLWAFGPTNAQDFARYLPAPGDTSAMNDDELTDAVDGRLSTAEMTTIAYADALSDVRSDKEARQ